MGYSIDEFPSDPVYFFQIGYILHCDCISDLMDRAELCVPYPSIGKANLMIFQRIIRIDVCDQCDQIRVLNDIENRLANRSLCIQAEATAHGGIQKKNILFSIEDHHAVVNIIEY